MRSTGATRLARLQRLENVSGRASTSSSSSSSRPRAPSPVVFNTRDVRPRFSRAGINRDKLPARASERANGGGARVTPPRQFHGRCSNRSRARSSRIITGLLSPARVAAAAVPRCGSCWQLGRLPPCRTSAARTSCDSIGRPPDRADLLRPSRVELRHAHRNKLTLFPPCIRHQRHFCPVSDAYS